MQIFNENTRVFDRTKSEELIDYDLNKGHLIPDKIVTPVPEVPAISVEAKARQLIDEGIEVVEIRGILYQITAESDSGRTVSMIVETPAIPASEDVEEIAVYIPYTDEELKQKAEKDYKDTVESLIRERYSLNDELAILRQRDSKPEEFAEYNAYAEECKTAAKATA